MLNPAKTRILNPQHQTLNFKIKTLKPKPQNLHQFITAFIGDIASIFGYLNLNLNPES